MPEVSSWVNLLTSLFLVFNCSRNLSSELQAVMAHIMRHLNLSSCKLLKFYMSKLNSCFLIPTCASLSLPRLNY